MPVAHLTQRTDLLLAHFLMLLILSRALPLSFSRSLTHPLAICCTFHLSSSLSLFVASIFLLKCNSVEQKAWEATKSEREKGRDHSVKKKQGTLSVLQSVLSYESCFQGILTSLSNSKMHHRLLSRGHSPLGNDPQSLIIRSVDKPQMSW